MKKVQLLIVVSLIAIATLFSGCNSGGLRKTTSGIQYKFLKKAKGDKKPKSGSFVEFHMVVKNAKDSTVVDTYKMGQTNKGQLPPDIKTKGDIFEMLMMMAEGDSALFKLSTDTLVAQQKRAMDEQIKQFKAQMQMQVAQAKDAATKKQIEDQIKSQEKMAETQLKDMVKQFPKGKYYTFIVKLVAVKNEAELKKEQEEMMKKQQEEMKKQEKADIEQKKKDIEIIKEYAKKNNLELKTTESGLHYQITQEGSGDKASAGDVVKVNYTGMLLDGKVFDTSIKEVAEKSNKVNPGRTYEPFKFTLGRGEVIRGWDEGISLLNKGTKAKLYIPSPLAYGSRGAGGDIPANSVLIFEVELVDIEKTKTEEKKEENKK